MSTRTWHPRLAHCAALLLLTWAVGASADGPSVPVGRWQGGGRACAGKLVILQHTLSWRTPFGQCVNQPFRFRDLGDEGSTGRSLFTLDHASPRCPFSSIELLRKPGTAGLAGDDRWEAIGYRSEADRQAARVEDALACPMVRLD